MPVVGENNFDGCVELNSTQTINAELPVRKFAAGELTAGFCADCLFDGEYYKCAHCKADMLYTNAAHYVYGTPKEEICADCKIIWQHTCERCNVRAKFADDRFS